MLRPPLRLGAAMPVYFIGENDSGYCRFKIGVAKDIEKRRSA